jgi:putative FmdB family regulatory protein
MPFYEYECSACKFYVEALQKISDPPIKKCPSCKKSTMKRLLSAPAFRLSGGGWYETDFKSDKENKRNLAGDEKDSGGTESKSEAASDSKPATETKSETKSEGKAERASEPAETPRTKRASVSARPKTKAKPKPKPKQAAKKK